MVTKLRALVCLGFALAGTATAVSAQNWPSFRGADATGVAAGSPPVNWDVAAGRNIRWKIAIPGLAHSSPIVWEDRVFVTTTVASSGTPAIKTGDSDRAGIGAAADIVSHTWHLMTIDRNSGRVLWDRDAYQGTPRVKRHVKASHASATPATNGRVIVAMLGSEGLFCFDMNGRQKWRQDLGPLAVGLADDPTYEWGPASSPVIDGSLVFVQNDRHKDSYVAAFDLETGKQVWRQNRSELPSWATPLVARSAAGTEVITNGARFFRSYDAATGRELWRLPDPGTEVKVPTPVLAGDLFILTGGYPAGGRPIYAVRRGGTGEVAPAWRAPNGSPYTGTPLVYEGILYVCTDNGILSAYDVKSGERIYRSRVSPGAAGFSASPVAAGGRVYLASEDGDIFVVKAGRAFELLSTNPMGEINMATPAISGNMLILRTQGHLLAVGAG